MRHWSAVNVNTIHCSGHLVPRLSWVVCAGVWPAAAPHQ